MTTPNWPGLAGHPALPSRLAFARKSVQLPFATVNGETDAPEILWGSGTPEGIIVGSPPDLFLSSDQGLWIKSSGVNTNTGWVSMSAASQVGSRFLDMEMMVGGLNSGDTLSATQPGYSRLNPIEQTITPVMFQFLAGVVAPKYRQLNGQRWASWFSATGSNTCYVFRPGQSTVFYCPFGALAFPPTTGALTNIPAPAYGWAISMMAYCRKLNAGDSSSSRMFFGFANNTDLSPSGGIPRVGLVGDGAGGYRYGSVNCPSPDQITVAPNADNAIDAGSVQPTDLQAPGANIWHSRIKIVPATPTQSARVGCYHNGVLVATYATDTNLPKGHVNSSDDNDYGRIEASILNFSGDTVGLHVPELCFSKVRVIADDDYTL